MSPRDTYNQHLAALLRDADGLGSTPDDLRLRLELLRELRLAAPWLAGSDEKPTTKTAPKPVIRAPRVGGGPE